MKITSVTMPDIKGKPVEKALEMLLDHCRDTAIMVMKLNNEIIDLKDDVRRLKG